MQNYIIDNNRATPIIKILKLVSKLLLIAALFNSIQLNTLSARADNPTVLSKPRVNIPYSAPGAPYPSHAIFWFGQVDLDHNYSDVRVIYYPEGIKFVIHTIDRRLWGEWDAISLYLNTNTLTLTLPQHSSYRFDVKLGGIKAIYQGNGVSWVPVSMPTNIQTSWRGDGPNNNGDDKGWQADVYIPFTSLGLSVTPALQTLWGLAVTVYDGDNAAGDLRLIKSWPTSIHPDNPSTWGEMSFGWKPFDHPLAISTGKTILRHGLNNIIVKDGEVGGHTICGSQVDHWTQWGNTNYNGISLINIQNQWDVSDWPCFSKFYLTFPLDTVPADKSIISAKLSLTLFGNAGGGNWGEPPDSFIQVFTVNDPWDEATLTWNNAPLAQENIAGIWVKPRDYSLNYETYTWEIKPAVETAYNSSQPLHLALYSADGERHTGKYFWTSDSTEWDGNIRPTLEIVWGDDCKAPGITCSFQYLPLISR